MEAIDEDDVQDAGEDVPLPHASLGGDGCAALAIDLHSGGAGGVPVCQQVDEAGWKAQALERGAEHLAADIVIRLLKVDKQRVDVAVGLPFGLDGL